MPLGYKYFAVESAEEVHKIVIDPDSKGTDMDAVFRDIRTLLKVCILIYISQVH